MHEMGITRSIVEMCCEEAQGSRVASVTVEIGSLCALMPDAVRFCYDVCTQGTPLEGSSLDIVAIPGQGHCRECGAVLTVTDWLALCSCGSANLELAGGDELRVKSMELA